MRYCPLRGVKPRRRNLFSYNGNFKTTKILQVSPITSAHFSLSDWRVACALVVTKNTLDSRKEQNKGDKVKINFKERNMRAIIKSAQRYHTRRGMATMPTVKPDCSDFWPQRLLRRFFMAMS